MSIEYPDLVRAGMTFFKGISYRGTGSAEFKLDERDGLLKLIELNPRYWQQNSLAEICGMNFPFVDYLEATGQTPHRKEHFRSGKKWLNIYMDFKSFLGYWGIGQLKFASWVRSLEGTRVLSDYANDDIVPAFYSISCLRNINHIRRFWRKALRGN
jgi:predicted ATP-grasp superfamily ATP-dependent carboligase